MTDALKLFEEFYGIKNMITFEKDLQQTMDRMMEASEKE